MSDFLVQHHRKFLGGGLVVAAAVAMFCGGCFGDGTTTVAGQVTSGGKPVTWGTVTVVAADNKVYSAPVRPDGSYQLTGIPRGPVRIAVTSPNPQSPFLPAVPAPPGPAARPDGSPANVGGPVPPRPPVGGTSAPAGAGGVGGKPKTQSLAMEATMPPPPVSAPAYTPKQWAPIPGKYGNPATSGLGAQAGRGPNRVDLNVD